MEYDAGLHVKATYVTFVKAYSFKVLRIIKFIIARVFTMII